MTKETEKIGLLRMRTRLSLEMHGNKPYHVKCLNTMPLTTTLKGNKGVFEALFCFRSRGSRGNLPFYFHNIFIEKNLNKKASTQYKSSVELKSQFPDLLFQVLRGTGS